MHYLLSYDRMNYWSADFEYLGKGMPTNGWRWQIPHLLCPCSAQKADRQSLTRSRTLHFLGWDCPCLKPKADRCAPSLQTWLQMHRSSTTHQIVIAFPEIQYHFHYCEQKDKTVKPCSWWRCQWAEFQSGGGDLSAEQCPRSVLEFPRAFSPCKYSFYLRSRMLKEP